MSTKNRNGILLVQMGLLFLLTILGSLFLFGFCKRQFNQDVREELQIMESQIYRTYFREYQRTGLIAQSLNQMTRIEDDRNLESGLDALYAQYGPDGELPGLVKSISYESLDNPGHLRHLYKGVWTSLSQEEAARAKPLYPGETRISGMQAGETFQPQILYSPKSRDEVLIQVELDKDLIDRNYVHPAIKELYPAFHVEWRKIDSYSGEMKIFKKGDGEGRKGMKYRPLAALLSLDHYEDEDYILPVPEGMKSHLPFQGKPRHSTSEFLVMGLDNVPFYFHMEHRWALTWLLGQTVILGISLILLILVLQMRRLKTLRKQEKEFVASMTHELRTPLTVIHSAADNLLKGIVPAEKIPLYGNSIKDQANRLGSMVEEILLFSSLEGKGKNPETPVVLSLSSLRKRIMERYLPLAEEKGISILWEDADYPKGITGYPREMELILSNLVANALFHAYPDKAGILRIKVKLLVSGKILLSVEDEGQGIPSSEQKKIFDPFYRAASSREQQSPGNGLGLFIAARKAELTGAVLRLECPYRRLDGKKTGGCRFTLELPCSFETPKNEEAEG